MFLWTIYQNAKKSLLTVSKDMSSHFPCQSLCPFMQLLVSFPYVHSLFLTKRPSSPTANSSIPLPSPTDTFGLKSFQMLLKN